MKFEFRLNGRDWLGLYITAFAVYAGHFAANQMLIHANGIQPGTVNPSNFGLAFLLTIIATIAGLFLYAPILRIFLANTRLGEDPFSYTGTTIGFVLRYIGYTVLSIITLGVYGPWAMKNMIKYVAENIQYRQNKLSFEGDGFSLFLIGLVALILPLFVVCIVFAMTIKSTGTNTFLKLPLFMLFYLAIIPFAYFAMKWMYNIRYNQYQIRWNTEAIPAIVKILQEVFLSIITLGIYAPAAHVRLYAYFVDKTKITGDDGTSYTLKTSLNTFEAWKTIWIQCLLTIITVGIYGAWAYCKMIALYANSTSIERVYGVSPSDRTI